MADIEALPSEFSVLGINDYMFIDGYRRVLDEKRRGRLTNIETFFPVIELRLDQFGGTESHLRKVNLHVIFSDELDPDVIEAQFISALAPSYKLFPEYAGRASWSAVLTRESLADLGKQIRGSVPPERLHEYGSDLEEGFANLTIPFASVEQILARPIFSGRRLVAVGKTEWASVRWNDQSIADKKHLINSADLVFISAEDPEHWRRNLLELRRAQVRATLFDCSDAHYPSNSEEKDRIGNCFTWVNADPSFAGLKHAILEFEHRVFVGQMPPKLIMLRDNPTRHIRDVSIRKAEHASVQGAWFDSSIVLNPGFVAIIGNKGKGKSALIDVLGLLGSSSNEQSFSFLNAERFRNPRDNKAKDFRASMTWASGEAVRSGLDDSIPIGAVERVKYLPQNLLENICNEMPGPAEGKFERELGEVIFSHVPPADRLGQTSLDDLIRVRSVAMRQKAQMLRAELDESNAELIELEVQASPENLTRLQAELRLKRQELAAVETSKPVAVQSPPEDTAADPVLAAFAGELRAAQAKREQLTKDLGATAEQANQQAYRAASAETVRKRLQNLQHAYDQFVVDTQKDLTELGLQLDQILTFEVNAAPLESISKSAESAKQMALAELDPAVDGSLAARRVSVESDIESLALKLDEPRRLYEEYLRATQSWEERLSLLIGDDATPGTFTYLQHSIAEFAELPGRIEACRKARLDKVRQIHTELLELASLYRSIYQPVQQFIQQHPLARDRFSLNFDVSLIAAGFENRLFEMINHAATGSFMGIEEGERAALALVRPTNFDSVEEVSRFLTQIDDALHMDQRMGHGQQIPVASQLRRGVTVQSLYDYVFGMEYVSPRYLLESRGKPISQLSPGEKGTLLLMFYLLVDKDERPILIDQPEENLDNQTVHDFLVPAIKEAKARRQVVLVTHSPNLAVVGDADQIICADFADECFSYSSGAIEDPVINQRIVDILEGTWPAFGNRDEKYQRLLDLRH